MATTKHRKSQTAGGDMDMTPMIDVVFQLIIFFIVTIKMEETANPDITLPDGRHGPLIKDQHPHTMVIEVDRFGWITMHNVPLKKQQLFNILKGRFQRYGAFPVLIRGDRRARHEHIRGVMDICTSVGLWKISFAAVQERKT